VAQYQVDPFASAVAVAANSTIHAVHIQAHGVTGTLEGELDREGRVRLDRPHHARLSIAVDELRSGNVLQDMEMDRRMDAARFPTIDCEVDALVANAGGYRASARLTVRGRTRPVQAEVILAAVAPGHVVVEAEHVFDMRDFGVSPPRLLVLRVDPQVRVRVRIEARTTVK
jgi:polyisoprenoid-binding protein YceI